MHKWLRDHRSGVQLKKTNKQEKHDDDNHSVKSINIKAFIRSVK